MDKNRLDQVSAYVELNPQNGTVEACVAYRVASGVPAGQLEKGVNYEELHNIGIGEDGNGGIETQTPFEELRFTEIVAKVIADKIAEEIDPTTNLVIRYRQEQPIDKLLVESAILGRKGACALCNESLHEACLRRVRQIK